MTPMAPHAAALLLICTLAAPPLAHADASLTGLRALDDIAEVSHRTEVVFDGTLAKVTQRMVWANAGTADHVGLYLFELDSTAAVTGLKVKLADGTVPTTVVAGAAAALSDRQLRHVKMAADVALLRLIESPAQAAVGQRSTYELRVYPVAPQKSVEVELSWVTPLSYEDGRVRLAIPARGDDHNLVREQVAVTLRSPAAAAGFGAIYGGGKKLASRAGRSSGPLSFLAPPKADIVIDAAIRFRGDKPIAELRSTRLAADLDAVTLSVLSPRHASSKPAPLERAVIVADISRSLGEPGIDAVTAAVTELLGRLPASARFELITFDRVATPVFGEFRSNNRSHRSAALRALANKSLRNGSDLSAGLGAAIAALDKDARGRRTSQTLVAVVSDGVHPAGFTSKAASAQLGGIAHRSNVTVGALVVVPPGTQMPALADHPLAAAVAISGGQLHAARRAEIDFAARRLASEYGLAATLTNLSLGGRGTRYGALVSGDLAAGQGRTWVGFSRGGAPAKLALTAQRSGKPFAVRVDRRRSTAAGALALATTHEDDLFNALATVPGTTTRRRSLEGQTAHFAAKQAFVAAPTVSTFASLVAIGGGGLAGDRAQLVRKWGPDLFLAKRPAPEQTGPRPAPYRRAPLSRQQRRVAVGTLSPRIVKRVIRHAVIPKARHCYEKALRSQKNLDGELSLRVEMAGGEVIVATLTRDTLGSAMVARCTVEAAYNIAVPKTAGGGDVIYVARYPLRFRRAKSGVAVERGSDKTGAGDPDDPLHGL